jgi:CRP/FNR family transcriptional regulator, cyclic AMP receptor protein
MTVTFLAGLDPAAAAPFMARVTRTTYEAGSLVVDFDDLSTDVFFIESGMVRVVVRNPGGREVILGDVGAGEIVGDMAAIDNLPRSANLTALRRAVIARMPGVVFVEMIAEVPEAARRMLKLLTGRIRLGNQRLLENATLDLKHRLYAELLRQARASPGEAGILAISPPPLQHVLAGQIGGRREAISREIAALLRRGILRRTPAALVIARPDILERDVKAQMDR